MLKPVLNQKQPPQPKKNPQIRPTQENPAKTHKNPRAHKTTRTNQNKATATQSPQRPPCRHSAPPTIRWSTQDHPEQTRPTPYANTQ